MTKMIGEHGTLPFRLGFGEDFGVTLGLQSRLAPGVANFPAIKMRPLCKSPAPTNQQVHVSNVFQKMCQKSIHNQFTQIPFTVLVSPRKSKTSGF